MTPKTTLTGGAITTTDKAKQQGLNQFTSKGGIETLDLNNHAQYEGNAIQAGYSLNGKKSSQDPQSVNPNVKTSWDGKTTGIGYGKDSDNQTSVTKAGITGVAGYADITTDNKANYAGVIKNNFDNNKIMQQLGSQTQITQAFGQEAPKAVGDYASTKQLELINAGNIEEAKKWGEGGIYRVALHTLSSALATGSIEGAVAGGGTAIAVPKVDEYLKQQGYDEDTRKAVLVGLSAGIGGAVGNSMAGLANSVNQTENNFLAHQERELLNKLLAKAKQNGGKLSVNDSLTLTKLIEKDQLTNALLFAYGDSIKNGKPLSKQDLDTLAQALNSLYARGGSDAQLAKNLISSINSNTAFRPLNYLDPRATTKQANYDKSRLKFYEIPFYTRNISDEEKIYRTAKNTLNMYNQQTELAKMGGDAVFGMPGKVGTVLRAGLAAKGAYDVGYGAGLAYNGDYSKGAVVAAGGVLQIIPATVSIPKSTGFSYNGKWDYLLEQEVNKYSKN